MKEIYLNSILIWISKGSESGFSYILFQCVHVWINLLTFIYKRIFILNIYLVIGFVIENFVST